MQRKLLLHIGVHKTGTSAIQRACTMNTKRLQKSGWAFANNDANIANWGNIFDFHKTDTDVHFRIPDEKMQWLIAALSSHTSNTILSCEDLFFLGEDEIKNFAKHVEPLFDAVEICVYLRRQDELAISQKSQGAKTIQSALVFGLEPGALPVLTKPVQEYLDFATKIETWKQAFKNATVIAREYNRPQLASGDIVTDFFNNLDIKIKSDGAKINTSLSANEVQLLLSLRAQGLTQADIARIGQEDWINTHTAGANPTQAQAREFLDFFAESNKNLEKVVGHPFQFHDDFSKYPEQPIETDYAKYERENLLQLVAKLADLSSLDTARSISAVARNIKQIRPRMALELVSIARKMHPHAPQIGKLHAEISTVVANMEKRT